MKSLFSADAFEEEYREHAERIEPDDAFEDEWVAICSCGTRTLGEDTCSVCFAPMCDMCAESLCGVCENH